MRRIVLTAVFMSLMGCWRTFGQIEVSLRIEPAHAVLYEPIKANVLIRNNTGSILEFGGGEPARFFFDVGFDKNEAVRQTDLNPLMYGARIMPRETRTNQFVLTSIYSMRSLGVYKINACIEWQDRLFFSAPIEVEIRRGFEIARLTAGVPGESLQLRVYVLEYMSKEDGENVYLRIEDEQEKKIYGMANLGHIVRVRAPVIKVDESGNVHVLFQTMSMDFIHTAFTPYGVQLFSRIYNDKTGAISLVSLPNGQVSVSIPPESGKPETSRAELPPDQHTLPKKLATDMFGTKTE